MDIRSEKVEIRKARPTDFPEMIEVLKHYHFILLPARQAAIIDPGCGESLTIYNEVTGYDWDSAFVARINGRLAGCAHYRMNNATEAKTTLIVVDPELRNSGVGFRLQQARMRAAYEAGARSLYTFCDTRKSADWYIRHFGYQEIGQEKNHHRLYYFDLNGSIIWGIHFGFPGCNVVIRLVCDLVKYFS